jgi:hypothetical protein
MGFEASAALQDRSDSYRDGHKLNEFKENSFSIGLLRYYPVKILEVHLPLIFFVILINYPENDYESFSRDFLRHHKTLAVFNSSFVYRKVFNQIHANRMF